MQNLYDIPVQTIDNQSTTLNPYKGKVLLIVNVASKCGFTPQYKALEELYRTYKDKGLMVLGFPCDQFLHQEPGDNQQIKSFAQSCFLTTFPLFAKIKVKGNEQAPVYTYLKKHMQKKPLFFIPWNFTKILVNSNGDVLKQYWPMTSLKKIEKDIEKLIEERTKSA